MGKLTFQANLGGSVNLIGPNTASTVNLTLPSAAGTDGQPLVTDASGNLSFATLTAANGGTGQTSYAVGDLLYASTSTAISKLADVATGNALISGGVGVAPSYGKIGLTTHVSGTLPTTNGGTGLTSFTANGVVYASSTSALATGSALTFDGTNLGVGTASPAYPLDILSNSNSTQRIQFKNSNAGSSATLMVQIANDAGNALQIYQQSEAGGAGSVVQANGTGSLTLRTVPNQPVIFGVNNSEQMRLTSTGLGIGTSSPAVKLDVAGAISATAQITVNTADGANQIRLQTAGVTKWINYTQSDGLRWYNTADRMTLDSSGNLGLGVTPTAWNGGYRAMQVGLGASFIGRTVNYETSITSNAVFSNANTRWDYIGTDAAAHYQQVSGQHRWYYAASGTAGNPISFTQAMTLDASGNLGLGTTSPGCRIDVNSPNNTSLSPTIRVNSNNVAVNTAISYDGIQGSGDLYVSTTSASAPIMFRTNNTERARIDSSGRFGINETSPVAQLQVSVPSGTDRVGVRSQQGHVTALSFFGQTTNGSYTGDGVRLDQTRSATSACNFLIADSAVGGSQDREFTMRGDGNAYADGTWNNNGADYAEFFESANGQALTLGASVVLDGNKVREATAQDPVSAIIGVVRPKEPSKASMVIGNTAWNKWANKYLTDAFDRYIMEDHEVVEWVDSEGKQYSYESNNIPDDVVVPVDATRKTHDDNGNKLQHYKLNPEWDKNAEYTPREQRPEWNIIGLVGQVKILKGQCVNDRWVKMRDVSSEVEEWFIR